MGIGGVECGTDASEDAHRQSVALCNIFMRSNILGEMQMYKYKCVVNPQDTLVTYETDNEIADEIVFALVAENRERGTKVSVLLTVEDAKLLCEQLHSFVKEDY